MRKTWEEFRLLYRYAERKKDLVYSFWCPKWAFWICSMILNLKASLLKKAFGKTLHKLVSMLEKNGIEGSDRWQMKGWVLWVGFSGNRCWDRVLGVQDVFRYQYLWERGKQYWTEREIDEVMMRLNKASANPKGNSSIVLQSAELLRSLHPTSLRISLGRAWPWLRCLFMTEGDPEGAVSPDAICWPLSQLPRQQIFSWRGIWAVSLRSTIWGWRQSSQYPFPEGLWSIC